MTKEELDQVRWGYSEKQRRARLLYCMDYLMHALNDEEAIEPWLVNGVEDGLYQAAPEPPARDYEGICETKEEFDTMVGVFIRTLADEGRFKPNGLPWSEIGKAVLA